MYNCKAELCPMWVGTIACVRCSTSIQTTRRAMGHSPSPSPTPSRKGSRSMALQILGWVLHLGDQPGLS